MNKRTHSWPAADWIDLAVWTTLTAGFFMMSTVLWSGHTKNHQTPNEGDGA